MTHQENYIFSKTFVDELIKAGFDGIPEMFKVIVPVSAMKGNPVIREIAYPGHPGYT